MSVTSSPKERPHRGLALALWLVVASALLLALDGINFLLNTVPSSSLGIDPSIRFSIGVPLRGNGWISVLAGLVIVAASTWGIRTSASSSRVLRSISLVLGAAAVVIGLIFIS